MYLIFLKVAIPPKLQGSLSRAALRILAGSATHRRETDTHEHGIDTPKALSSLVCSGGWESTLMLLHTEQLWG